MRVTSTICPPWSTRSGDGAPTPPACALN